MLTEICGLYLSMYQLIVTLLLQICNSATWQAIHNTKVSSFINEYDLR
jgi:hypothetical protein